MRYTLLLTLAAAVTRAAPLSNPTANTTTIIDSQSPPNLLDRRVSSAQNASNSYQEMKAAWEKMSKHRELHLTYHNAHIDNGIGKRDEGDVAEKRTPADVVDQDDVGEVDEDDDALYDIDLNEFTEDEHDGDDDL